MQVKKKERQIENRCTKALKTHTLLWATVALVTVLLYLFGVKPLPLSTGDPIWNRLTYHFFHGSIFHLLANLLAVYAISKRGLSYSSIVIAFIIACLAPATGTQVVGLSGFLFALVGVIYGFYLPAPKAVTWVFIIYVINIVCATAIPQMAVEVHISTFTSGIFVGFIKRVIGDKL